MRIVSNHGLSPPTSDRNVVDLRALADLESDRQLALVDADDNGLVIIHDGTLLSLAQPTE